MLIPRTLRELQHKKKSRYSPEYGDKKTKVVDAVVIMKLSLADWMRRKDWGTVLSSPSSVHSMLPTARGSQCSPGLFPAEN